MTSPVPQYLATLAASQAVVMSTLSPGERAYLDQWDAEALALLDGYGLDLGDMGQVHAFVLGLGLTNQLIERQVATDDVLRSMQRWATVAACRLGDHLSDPTEGA